QWRQGAAERKAVPARLFHRPHYEFHRPRVPRKEVRLVLKLRGIENIADHRLHRGAVLEIHGADGINEFWIGRACFADEEVIELCRETACRLGVACQSRYQIDAVLHPRTGRTRRYGLSAVWIDRKAEGLCARLVLVRVIYKAE